MPKKITWWPASAAKGILKITVLLMRYDWPDQRIYEIGMYVPGVHAMWTNSKGEALSEIPDYFVYAGDITEFVKIPAECEYTFGPKHVAKPKETQ